VKISCLLMIAVFALGCGGSAHDELTAARGALADADYEDALAAANSGLADDPDDTTQWGLELVKLEALARGGDGAGAAAQLNALAERHPNRVPVTQYSATAHQLRAAGRKPEAIEVLDAGVKRFPDEAMLVRLIGAEDSEGMESAELDMLRSLGYVE
jgi:tetratricopeptide (TPR) repeat protein